MSEKIKHFPGEQLRGRDIREGRVPAIKFRPNIKYAWSTGVAMNRFIEGLKQGKIAGSSCNKCGRIMVPPRSFCEECFKATDGYTYVKDTGTINTYSVSYVAGDASRIKEPILVAVIDLDGASKGMGILHLLGEIDDWKQISFGMRVKAVWKPPEERTGTITDIKYFAPIREE
ncbi:MAG: Zn-ribbon domain-containing OB-fold protein [Candidatus Bathyarchaeota archaeon]|nr:MAG: Zn-ribbon domain-containing OB-fold protein [Candidatus Bathyarchaeota archaeon]